MPSSFMVYLGSNTSQVSKFAMFSISSGKSFTIRKGNVTVPELFCFPMYGEWDMSPSSTETYFSILEFLFSLRFAVFSFGLYF